VRILGVSGSLRQHSSNTTALRAVGLLAPAGLELVLSDHLGALPHFNPDLEETSIPAVSAWRAALLGADGALICTPEYAHGLPGALKNALDWCVGSGEFVGKPVAVLNISPASSFADESLREVLRTMDARVFPEALGIAGFRHTRLDASSLSAQPEFAEPVRRFLESFVLWLTAPKT
jgi:chromate reductase, NAD(P)H dehydrogenase (quinone)